jgi:D-lactate dehydrogenase (cytochrome)
VSQGQGRPKAGASREGHAPAQRGAGTVCPRIDGRERILSGYARYLKDESGLCGGVPARIYLPTTLEELRGAVEEIAASGEKLTTSGARTGLVGGAVPGEGASLVVMERLSGGLTLMWSEERNALIARVPASMTLAGLEEALARDERARGWFYPVDPTETSSSLGGNVATNASGAHSYRWGPTRNWVSGLTSVMADGSMARVQRRCEAPFTPAALEGRNPRTVRIESAFLDGRTGSFDVSLPCLRLPLTKNTAGYFTGGEPIDLFIGSEGTLGIAAEVDLILRRAPGGVIGVCAFPRERDECLELMERLKASELPLLALEYMDRRSLELLARWRREGGDVPRTPEGAGAMLYVETEPGEEGPDAALAEMAGALDECGMRDDRVWAATSPADFQRIKKLRHALPVRVNDVIAHRAAAVPGITKLAADLAVPDVALRTMMAAYDEVLSDSRLSYVLFGHIGDSHIHMNVLAESGDDLVRGRRACEELARRAVAMGGSISAEHGVGRLKKHLIPIQFPTDDLDEMRKVKTALDPRGVLNPGVIW